MPKLGQPSSQDYQPKGYLRRALSSDGRARIVTVDITEIVQDLLIKCQIYPPSVVHVGQGAMAALMLQALSDTEDDDKVECQWSNTGPFGNLYADALGTGKIRVSIANPRVEIPSLSESMGKGLLQIRRIRKGLEPSVGIIESSGFVGEDISLYLSQSEQRQSGLNLSVKLRSLSPEQALKQKLENFPFVVEKAAGYLVDILGDTELHQKEQAMKWWQVQMDVLGPISEWALSESSETATLEMLKMLTMKEQIHLTLNEPVQSFCTCSQEKVLRALRLLSQAEQQSLIDAEGKTLIVDCQYCGSSYSVELSELAVTDS